MQAPSAIVAILLAVALAGCAQGKANCSYPVADPDSVVVALADPAPSLARAEVSGQETGLGDAITDAYRQALQRLPGAPSAVFEVASAIRDDGVCPLSDGGMVRLAIPQGPSGEVTTRALRDAFPGPDRLVVVHVTLSALFNILEHGVTGPVGSVERSSGRFVMASGLNYTVDCNQPPEGATQLGVGVVRTMEGRRVRSLQIDRRLFARDDARANTETFSIALPESLARGGDEFFDLRDAFAREGESVWEPTDVQSYAAVEAYFRSLGAAVGGRVPLRTDGRISFVNCSSTQ